jgi:hypothetical protein
MPDLGDQMAKILFSLVLAVWPYSSHSGMFVKGCYDQREAIFMDAYKATALGADPKLEIFEVKPVDKMASNSLKYEVYSGRARSSSGIRLSVGVVEVESCELVSWVILP